MHEFGCEWFELVLTCNQLVLPRKFPLALARKLPLFPSGKFSLRVTPFEEMVGLARHGREKIGDSQVVCQAWGASDETGGLENEEASDAWHKTEQMKRNGHDSFRVGTTSKVIGGHECSPK